ncbi:Na+/H+ antiporter subunit E [Spirochaeta dissipatitropha]
MGKQKKHANRIRQLLHVVIVAAVFTVIWCIWSESFALSVIAQGLFCSLAALFIVNRFLLRGQYQFRYSVKPAVLIKYVLVLIVQIFKSGFDAVYITLTDRINVGVVDLPTMIDDPLVGTLIANAITLTPGTATIDYDTKRFKVIWINCTTTDPIIAGEIIKADFERVFLGNI